MAAARGGAAQAPAAWRPGRPLAGVTVAVTGANRGIGYEMVQQLLEPDRGNTVVATTRDPARAAALRGLADPDRLLVTTLDVASPSSVAAWAEAELAEVGHVDVVINNAGVLPARGKDIETVAAADMLEAFTVKTVGPVLVVQALVRAREWGCARRRAGGRAATDEDLHAPAGRDGAAERREAGRGAPEHRRQRDVQGRERRRQRQRRRVSTCDAAAPGRAQRADAVLQGMRTAPRSRR